MKESPKESKRQLAPPTPIGVYTVRGSEYFIRDEISTITLYLRRDCHVEAYASPRNDNNGGGALSQNVIAKERLRDCGNPMEERTKTQDEIATLRSQ